MSWQIKLPVRDPDQPLDAKALSQIPDYIQDPDDRAVTREFLFLLKTVDSGLFSTVGRAEIALDVLTKAERRQLLDKLRKRAGLETASDIEAEAQRTSTEESNRRKMSQDRRPLRLAYTPAGVLVDLNEADDEAARVRADESHRAAQHEAKAAERAAEAEALREHEAARAEELRRLTPKGVPVP